jgi:hypothetical protein
MVLQVNDRVFLNYQTQIFQGMPPTKCKIGMRVSNFYIQTPDPISFVGSAVRGQKSH